MSVEKTISPVGAAEITAESVNPAGTTVVSIDKDGNTVTLEITILHHENRKYS